MFSHSHLLKELQQFIVENDASAVAGVPATVGCFCPWFPFEFAAAFYSVVFYVMQSLLCLIPFLAHILFCWRLCCFCVLLLLTYLLFLCLNFKTV
jgi:hypothetical protein